MIKNLCYLIAWNLSIVKYAWPHILVNIWIFILVRFKSNQREYNIIDLEIPKKKNYVVLESLNQLKEKNNYKSIQVVTLNDNERILMVNILN